MLGNDDEPELAEILRASRQMTYAEDCVVDLPGGYRMASFGYSTPTPWKTPRELTDDEIAVRLDALVAPLFAEPEFAVLNAHCPPAGTHLDQAAQLDGDLRPVVDATGVVKSGVGSVAVRQTIERLQPVLGLHGHVHELLGTERLGETLCVNPGLDYGDGVLRGAIIDLEPGRGVASWQLVHG